MVDPRGPEDPAPLRRRAPMVLGAVVVLIALVGAGAAVGVSKLGEQPGAARTKTVIIHTAPGGARTTATTTTGRTRPGPVAESTGPTDQEAIRSVIARYYADVTARRFRAAWALLSPSYRAWKLDNGGYSKWLATESYNGRRLTIDRVKVRITGRDPATDVATVFVSGMTYRKPGGPCLYQGYTWVRRFGGRWYYDQGYAQDPARAAEWSQRAQETLGVPCEPNGY